MRRWSVRTLLTTPLSGARIDGMRFGGKTIVVLVVAALVALVAVYACRDDAPSAAGLTPASTAVPAQGALPASTPPAVSAVILTPTPTPSVQTPSATPTVLPVSIAYPEFGSTVGAEVARRQPRDVSRFKFFSGNSDGAAYYDEGVSSVEDVLERGLHLAGASPVHQAFRGTASVGSARCEWRGVARTLAQREAVIRFRL